MPADLAVVFDELQQRRGQLVTGVVRGFVRRVVRGDEILVELDGGIEAVLPKREQTPRECYEPGEPIVALLLEVGRDAGGPHVVLSRANVDLVVKLFAREVPEIHEGTVKIVRAAREPGARTKLAVNSDDADVDPVAACVGIKGSRVTAVVQELRGERIDIVPYDADPVRFVCSAIAPADVSRVMVDEQNHAMELVVPQAKLSLAIGRRAQNVRLASKLTGWKLEIIGE